MHCSTPSDAFTKKQMVQHRADYIGEPWKKLPPAQEISLSNRFNLLDEQEFHPAKRAADSGALLTPACAAPRRTLLLLPGAPFSPHGQPSRSTKKEHRTQGTFRQTSPSPLPETLQLPETGTQARSLNQPLLHC